MTGVCVLNRMLSRAARWRAKARLANAGFAAALVVSFLWAVPAHATDTAADRAAPDEAPCGTRIHAGSRFLVCRYDLRRVEVVTRWRSASQRPFANLLAARQTLRDSGRTPLFTTNGGMYSEDLAPVGYYVERRRKLKNANTRRGPGNFHMLPNGIFFVEGGRAGVMETRAFLRRNRRPDYATQSGPMLVIDGRLHRRFDPQSLSRKARNGVGVSADGRTVYFAITQDASNFHSFATLFQRVLKTPNALFLDGGSVPQMWAVGGVTRLSFAPVGPIIAVVEKPATTGRR